MVTIDVNIAISKYEKAANENSYLTMYLLNHIYLQDIVSVPHSLLPKDDEKANIWLATADKHPCHCYYCEVGQWDDNNFWELK
jgi:hypothetical protein